MLTRRNLILGASLMPLAAQAVSLVPVHYPPHKYPLGSLVIHMGNRGLFHILGENYAHRYDVGIARPGKEWVGRARITEMQIRPAWVAPQDVIREVPNVPHFYPSGHPENPLGERAMLLSKKEVAIHGTNFPQTIGWQTTFGCFRMRNPDIIHLYNHVSVGTQVIVTA